MTSRTSRRRSCRSLSAGIGSRVSAAPWPAHIDRKRGSFDLAAAFRTAYRHCRPGGVALFFPDHLAETYQPGTDCGGDDAEDGSGARYLAWSLPPEPGATTVRTEYTFTLREADGRVRAVHETHTTGLFPAAVWRELLAAAGFAVSWAREEGGQGRTIFIGHRPPAQPAQ